MNKFKIYCVPDSKLICYWIKSLNSVFMHLNFFWIFLLLESWNSFYRNVELAFLLSEKIWRDGKVSFSELFQSSYRMSKKESWNLRKYKLVATIKPFIQTHSVKTVLSVWLWLVLHLLASTFICLFTRTFAEVSFFLSLLHFPLTSNDEQWI